MVRIRNVPDEKRKTENLNVPITAIQKEKIGKRAMALEKTVAMYVRNILFPEDIQK